jgi:anti-anti-sigma factor
MQDQIRVHVQVFDDKIAIINLAGEVTTCAEEAIKRAYRQVSARNIDNIIFNFKETNYVDSLGICIFIDVIIYARQKRQRLILNLPSPYLQKIFHIAGLNHYITIYDSLDEAIIAAQTGCFRSNRRQLVNA